MSYHLDFNTLGLDFLEHRLATEDLIPSHLPLREGLADRLSRLKSAGIVTLADLEQALKKDAGLKKLSELSGLPAEELKLLARVLGGYRPKPALLSDYPGVSENTTAALFKRGIRDSKALWDITRSPGALNTLASGISVNPDELRELASLADLSRIQWVSLLFARLLYLAGYRSVADVASGRAEELMERVAAVNQRDNLFKGKIGQKDMGRLVYLAGLLMDGPRLDHATLASRVSPALSP
jgi:hypothetical protein